VYLEQHLQNMVTQGASDVFITVGRPVSAKINGRMTNIAGSVLTSQDAYELIQEAMTPDHLHQFKTAKECNFAIALDGIGRFRYSAFWQREMPGMVVRRIVTDIPQADDLGLPDVLKNIIMAKRGLVLFVGGTGTGKSTSLAALIDHRNKQSSGHILTIEDPIEFVHEHQQCVVTQREVGIDTHSFDDALKSSLRQAPDVILIGEIRSMETMEYAMSFADTGHLCVATLHANNANQAIERIMHLAPKDMHDKLRFDMSLNIRAIEVLLNTPLIRDLIQRNEMTGLKDAMIKGKEMGMQTFDIALMALYRDNQITLEQALHHADSPNDLRLMIKLDEKAGNSLGSLSNVSFDMD
jgi:twitching motility protein PilU